MVAEPAPVSVPANPASEFEYIVTNKEADEEYHRIDITKYIGNADTVVIPAIIDGYPVDSIGRGAFFTENGVALIKQIEIQEGISEIYPEAFYGQSELRVPPRLCKPQLSDRIKGNGGNTDGEEKKEPHAV